MAQSKNIQICILLGTLFVGFGALAPQAEAVALGVNYYHETMMSEQWDKLYFPVTEEQVIEDMHDISTISGYVKLYVNPLVAGNVEWVETVNAHAKQAGLHSVITVMVDDRDLHAGNWDTYTHEVLEACTRFDGAADEFIVGNEIVLNSNMDAFEVRERIVPLIEDCAARFSGPVTYQLFWYEEVAWRDYPGQLYINVYEPIDVFTEHAYHMESVFGSRAIVGEWGSMAYDYHHGAETGDVYDFDWQRDEISMRWDVLQELSTPVAYIFAYREPSENGFGIVSTDGTKRPTWEIFLEAPPEDLLELPESIPAQAEEEQLTDEVADEDISGHLETLLEQRRLNTERALAEETLATETVSIQSASSSEQSKDSSRSSRSERSGRSR